MLRAEDRMARSICHLFRAVSFMSTARLTSSLEQYVGVLIAIGHHQPPLVEQPMTRPTQPHINPQILAVRLPLLLLMPSPDISPVIPPRRRRPTRHTQPRRPQILRQPRVHRPICRIPTTQLPTAPAALTPRPMIRPPPPSTFAYPTP